MWRHHLFQQSWRGIQHRVRQITISTTHAYTRIQIPDPTRTHRIWEASVLANTTAPQLPTNFSNRPTNSPTAKRTTNRALMAIPDHTGRVSTYKGSLRRRSSSLKASRYCQKIQVSSTHSLTHPPTHSLTHSLTHPLTPLSLTLSLTHPLINLLAQTTTHSLSRY